MLEPAASSPRPADRGLRGCAQQFACEKCPPGGPDPSCILRTLRQKTRQRRSRTRLAWLLRDSSIVFLHKWGHVLLPSMWLSLLGIDTNCSLCSGARTHPSPSCTAPMLVFMLFPGFNCFQGRCQEHSHDNQVVGHTPHGGIARYNGAYDSNVVRYP